MRKSDQISLRPSEARSAQAVAARELGTLLDIETPEKADEHRALVTEANTQLRTRQTDVEKYEGEWREARQAEIEAGDTGEQRAHVDGQPDAELRELMDVNQRASIGTYIDAIANDQVLGGAEDELRQAWGLGHGMVPWSLLDPTVAGSQELRADANASTPSTLPAYLSGIVGRVFTRSSTMFLGIVPTPVPEGDRLYYQIGQTAGGTAEFKAAGADKDAEDIVLTPKSVAPSRLVVRYSLKVEDIARIGSAYEPAIRADAVGAMNTALDKSTIAGGASPDLPGLITTLANPTDPSAVATYGSAASTLAGAVDGFYAHTMKDLRVLAGASTYAYFEGIFSTGSGESAGELYDRRSGGYRVSGHIPAIASKVQKAIVAKVGANDGMRNTACPVWNAGPTLTVDRVTGAQSGTVKLTRNWTMLKGFVILRDSGFETIEFKLVA